MFQFSRRTLLLFMFLMPAVASAGVEIGGTRLVYDGNSKQASISVNNPDNRPFLIQSWVNKSENGDDNDETFITTPPLFRLEPHTQNSVRVVLSNNQLPQDKESVYWLNIKSIPANNSKANNELLIAVKARMKLIYRPAGLSGDPATAWQELTFNRKNGALFVSNPTPYSVSLYDLKVNGKEIKNLPMVLPGQEVSLGQSVSPGSQIHWRAINDFGGITAEHQTTL
ncbi:MULTISPECIES: molecular chaperone [unclassified Serratia (in: enterobacteria)]|uniref:fimbrial biogenesis chaperone n=1 Tax=unclassified Serratia (in: enterobacteria) TaxID=2647522 RepID=UPI000501B6B9|nr:MULTISPECIES: molecular chaperone [unclassified Serratia (in: enterobacteria)]KFK92344.1 fimbrial assembly protein [Serratia sp. Ag2]KFL00020.1 fimbrial assembly protein [Serratia sp. Ag1]